MYKLIFHKGLTPEKWGSFGKAKQLLMIANELNRAKNNMREGGIIDAKECYERAFELLDLTIAVNKGRNFLYELLRFREILGAQYLEENLNESTNQALFDILISLDKDSYCLLQGYK
jgi:hypothetical protein